MEMTIMDFIWISCVMISLFLFYLRKILLTRHGFKMYLIDFYMKDFGHLKEVIKKENNQEKRQKLAILNYSVSITFWIGVIILVLTKAKIF